MPHINQEDLAILLAILQLPKPQKDAWLVILEALAQEADHA